MCIYIYLIYHNIVPGGAVRWWKRATAYKSIEFVQSYFVETIIFETVNQASRVASKQNSTDTTDDDGVRKKMKGTVNYKMR